MSDNLIIATLLWEKGGVVYRRWLVQTTGERTLPGDVPLPERVELNFQEHLMLGKRMVDPGKSERRKGKNDIVVLCAHATVNPTFARKPEGETLANFQSYWVLDKRYIAEALAEEHMERCLALGIPVRSVYPLPTPTEWAFEVWAEDGKGGAYFDLAGALLREIAAERGIDITFANSATVY